VTEPSAPRVAVVIPCHNDGEFLADALGSLADQEPCEVVVVDDGSDVPGTLAILDRLERDGVRVVHQANQGLSAARMTGVASSFAPYVHPLDADDRLPPGALTRLADRLDADPRADAAWGDYEIFGRRRCRVPSADSLDPWRITYVDEIPGTSLVRRTRLLEVGGWDMGSGYEDWDLWMKLAEAGASGVHVPEVTLSYREHATPRMYRQSLARTTELRAGLAARRHRLFAERRRNWRHSRSSLGVKLLFPLVAALPIPELRRQQAYALIRDVFEPRMSSDCFWGPRARLRRWRSGRARPRQPVRR
jgi:glycosyltransferase involved in cell wall biosynthesis